MTDPHPALAILCDGIADKRLSRPRDAIKYALMLAQDDRQDALEFLQLFIAGDLKGLSAWDWKGRFRPEDF